MAPKRPHAGSTSGHDNSSAASDHAPKHARTAHNARATAGSSQADPWVLDDDDNGDDHDASQVAPDASQGYDEQQYSYTQYGALAGKVVGVRYYTGFATAGEMVLCRREPHNAYDKNAIQVLNVQERQIGHLPRTLAAKLAKYLDNRTLLIEAQITGPMGAFDCPLDMKLYGTNEPEQREQLLTHMRSDKLPVGQAAERKRKETAASKERQKLAKEAARQAKKRGDKVVDVGDRSDAATMADFAAGSSQGLGPGPSLEEFIGGSARFNPRSLDHVFEEFGVKEQDLVNFPELLQAQVLTVI